MKRTLMLLTAAVVVLPSVAAASQSQSYGQSAAQPQTANPAQGSNPAQDKKADAAVTSNQFTATCTSAGKSADSKSRAPAAERGKGSKRARHEHAATPAWSEVGRQWPARALA